MKADDISILYENDDILIISKPSGLLVIPDRYDESAATVLDILKNKFPHLFVVHRIDCDTSGALMLAKTPEAHKEISTMFMERDIEKSYLAIVRGQAQFIEKTIDVPLNPDGDRLHRTVIDFSHGKPSETKFIVENSFKEFTLLRAEPKTGRTHQIRAHAAHMAHSIVCDNLYGSSRPVKLSEFKRSFRGDPKTERPIMARLALHASCIAFDYKGEHINVECPLFKDMKAFLQQLEKNNS